LTSESAEGTWQGLAASINGGTARRNSRVLPALAYVALSRAAGSRLSRHLPMPSSIDKHIRHKATRDSLRLSKVSQYFEWAPGQAAHGQFIQLRRQGEPLPCRLHDPFTHGGTVRLSRISNRWRGPTLSVRPHVQKRPWTRPLGRCRTELSEAPSDLRALLAAYLPPITCARL